MKRILICIHTFNIDIYICIDCIILDHKRKKAFLNNSSFIEFVHHLFTFLMVLLFLFIELKKKEKRKK